MTDSVKAGLMYLRVFIYTCVTWWELHNVRYDSRSELAQAIFTEI